MKTEQEIVKQLLAWAERWENVTPTKVGKARRLSQLWDIIDFARSAKRNGLLYRAQPQQTVKEMLLGILETKGPQDIKSVYEAYLSMGGEAKYETVQAVLSREDCFEHKNNLWDVVLSA